MNICRLQVVYMFTENLVSKMTPLWGVPVKATGAQRQKYAGTEERGTVEHRHKRTQLSPSKQSGSTRYSHCVEVLLAFTRKRRDSPEPSRRRFQTKHSFKIECMVFPKKSNDAHCGSTECMVENHMIWIVPSIAFDNN